jgi:hypothetical protein
MDNSPTGNQNKFFGTKVSIPGINVNNAGDNQLVLRDDYSSRIYYNNSGVPTVLLGLRKSTTPVQRGLFVSQDGIDVTQATDAQLVFNSNQNIFKIVKSGNTSIPPVSFDSSGGLIFQSIIIPHGFSFIPVLQAYAQIKYINFPTGVLSSNTIPAYVTLPYNGNAGFAPNGNYTYYIDAAIDNTNIYFTYYYFSNSAYGAASFPTTPIKYNLLQNTVN